MLSVIARKWSLVLRDINSPSTSPLMSDQPIACILKLIREGYFPCGGLLRHLSFSCFNFIAFLVNLPGFGVKFVFQFLSGIFGYFTD